MKRAPGDRGLTLVELLVTIVIIGASITALLGSLTALLRSSSLNETQANHQRALSVAAEAIGDPALAYTRCPGTPPNPYTTAVSNALTAAQLSSITVNLTVQYWNGNSFDSTCRDNNSGIGAAERMQLLTLSTRVPGSSSPWTMAVIKRDRS